MFRGLVRESSYRFRATFRERWAGYLTLVVLIGLVGGVAMAAVAGARRTQSSFPTYLASTNPSDLGMFTEFGPITNTGYSEKVNAAVARVPYVERAVDVVGFDGTLQVLGHHHGTGVPGEAPPALEGSTGADAEYFSSDRVTVLRGRMADPAQADEIVMSAGAAAQFGLHIGSTLPVAFFTDFQANQPNFSGYPRDKPHLIVPFKLVGIVEWDTQVVQDDDAALGKPDRDHHARADQAARDVLRLLLLRLVPSRRRIGARGGRRLRREQGHPRPGPRGGRQRTPRTSRRPSAPSAPNPSPSGCSGSSPPSPRWSSTVR